MDPLVEKGTAPEIAPDHPHRALNTVSIIIVVAFVAAAGAWYFGFFPALPERGVVEDVASGTYNTTTNTPFVTLTKQNPTFVEANALFDTGRYAEAIAKYQESLANAVDPVQEGQIKWRIALSQDFARMYPEAIASYKEVASNQLYSRFVRAYSVQNMAAMLLKPETLRFKSEIFTGVPYGSIGNLEGQTATNSLFEYAASIYPLAFSELYTANFYASRLVSDATVAANEKSAILAVIQDKLANADADIERLRVTPNERPQMSEALKRRATLLGKLVQLGVESAETADTAFKEALALNAVSSPAQEGYVRFYYAQFLESLGESRVEDLRSVLAPFYEDDAYADSSVMAFFAAEKNNQLNSKVSLQRIAAADPKFKQMLTSLGWTDADLRL